MISNKWKATKAKRVLSALLRIGYEIVGVRGSHKKLYNRETNRYYSFTFHDKREVSSVELAVLAKQTGLAPEDL